MLSFYLSLFGAPNLEPIDAPANATGPAPSGLSTANLRANWGPSFAPGCELTDGLANTLCVVYYMVCYVGTSSPTASPSSSPASPAPYHRDLAEI